MDQIRAKEETVVIYDDFGIPSIMRRIPKMTNAELFGGSDETNGTFIIGGKEYDEIYLPVYEGSLIDGRLYSLPYREPATNMTLEQMEKACFDKGDGWHLMTAMEWGLLANMSIRDSTLPHGNTAGGVYHADHSEQGVTYDGFRTLTGSGPKTWTHNHQIDGIHDLGGNVWERLRGLRLMDGRIQAPRNNDGALPIDLRRNSEEWIDITTDGGTPLHIANEGGKLGITTAKPDGSWSGCRWGDVVFHAGITERMKELGLYAGEPDVWLFADPDGERCACRGGSWGSGTSSGVFALSFNYSRSYAGASLGGRPAYFKRKTAN